MIKYYFSQNCIFPKKIYKIKTVSYLSLTSTRCGHGWSYQARAYGTNEQPQKRSIFQKKIIKSKFPLSGHIWTNVGWQFCGHLGLSAVKKLGNAKNSFFLPRPGPEIWRDRDQGQDQKIYKPGTGTKDQDQDHDQNNDL